VNRRDVIAGLLVAATIGRAHAQQKTKIYRLAVVHPSAPVSDLSETGSRRYRAFFQRLRELGYIEGQNLSVERYTGEGRPDAEMIGEVIRGNPDLIFVVTVALAREVKRATDTVPIVAIGFDPVALGVVPSLARPGGNITGATTDAGVEITGKSVELLQEMVPAASRVAWLASPMVWESPYGAAIRGAAQRIKISLIGPPVEAPFQEAEYRHVFVAMGQEGADALVVSGESQHLTNRRLVVELAEKARLPAIYPYREFTDIGGLMAYGADPADINRHAADQVDQVLKGRKPEEIPFYQPTKFEMVINLKTAKALGLTAPDWLLARADEVIE
jgi:putative ABC transport system substrate-binding protein